MVNMHQIKGLDDQIALINASIPTNVSDLVNDAGYLTNTDIAELVNGVKFSIVQELPTTDIKANVIYIVRDNDATGDNVYTEYIYMNGAWEVLGARRVDLSGFLTKNDFSMEVVQAQEEVLAVDGSTVFAGDNVLRITVADRTYHVLINRGNDFNARITALETTVGNQVLTNFVAGNDTSNIVASDTVLTALAKLQNRIADIEQNVIYAGGQN